MAIGPSAGNNELFVNDNPPGTASSLHQYTVGKTTTTLNPEYLLLVNGQDDNANGWTDEGFDGVDNNLAYENANGLRNLTDEGLEWETEPWHGAITTELATVGQMLNLQYTIQRRPVPVSNAREVLLPSNVVIDLSTWGYPFPTTANPNLSASLERSRLPVNPFSGYVDILVYPNGTVIPATIYSTPSTVGMSGAFLHFWLAERSDVVAPDITQTSAPYLPLPQGLAPARFSGHEIKGEYRLVTLFTRTGQLTTNDNVPFDSRPTRYSELQHQPSLPAGAAGSQEWAMIKIGTQAVISRRRGITLTEILIAILILAVGLASLATLFPLGLLRLREAARSTRSAYLMESAAADIVSRGLLTSSSFQLADQYNYIYSSTLTPWFTTTTPNGGQTYTPLTQDTPGYYQDWFTPATKTTPMITLGANSGTSGGYGLPFAYDPLWRFQTISQRPASPGLLHGRYVRSPVRSGPGICPERPRFPQRQQSAQRPRLAAAHELQSALLRQFDHVGDRPGHGDFYHRPDHFRVAGRRGHG